MNDIVDSLDLLTNSAVMEWNPLLSTPNTATDIRIQNCWESLETNKEISSLQKQFNPFNTQTDAFSCVRKKEKKKEEQKEAELQLQPSAQSQNIFIGVINGMNNLFSDAKRNAEYLESFIPKLNTSVDLTYNQTNGIIRDLGEIFLMNYGGISLNTANELIMKWSRFFAKNRDTPALKLLHFCHSQGAIHTRNALMRLPLMIRNRIIVVAIAPAVIIPRELCYRSYNYASKNDIIPHGELAFRGFFDSQECGVSPTTQQVIDWHSQLILLEPHPNEKGMGHSFQNPTFAERIKSHIMEYLLLKGTYQ